MKGKPTKTEISTRRQLTPQQEAELKALAAMKEEEIDTSDIPEVSDWSGAQRGKFYRPVKQQLTLRLDADLIDWFKRHTSGTKSRVADHKDHTPRSKGYQTRINQVLRQYVARHQRRKAT